MNLQSFFYAFVFLMFLMPNDLIGGAKIGPILLSLNELCGFFLVVVWAFLPKKKLQYQPEWLIRLTWIGFCSATFLAFIVHLEAEFITRTCRIFFPFVVSGLFICFPPILDSRQLLASMSSSIVASLIISLFMYFLGFDYSMEHKDRELSVEALSSHGRFLFKNASYGLVGLFLFYLPKFDNHYLALKRPIVIFGGTAGLVGLLLAFNRTYLGLLALHWVALQWTFRRNLSGTIKSMILVTLLFVTGVALYESNDQIKRQVDKRILSIVGMNFDQIYEKLIVDGGREEHWMFAISAISDNWLFGMPSSTPLFWKPTESGPKAMFIIDNPIATVWIRSGLLSMACFIGFWTSYLWYLYSRSRQATSFDQNLVWSGFCACVFFYVLASLNMNSILTHATVQHIAILHISLINLTNHQGTSRRYDVDRNFRTLA